MLPTYKDHNHLVSLAGWHLEFAVLFPLMARLSYYCCLAHMASWLREKNANYDELSKPLNWLAKRSTYALQYRNTGSARDYFVKLRLFRPVLRANVGAIGMRPDSERAAALLDAVVPISHFPFLLFRFSSLAAHHAFMLSMPMPTRIRKHTPNAIVTMRRARFSVVSRSLFFFSFSL